MINYKWGMPVNIRLEINSQKTNQNQVIQSYGHYE